MTRLAAILVLTACLAGSEGVLCLRPGDADIRTLSSGVYYVATGVPGVSSKAAVRKVIVIE